MSKDMLGSLVRVLITVPEDRLGLMQDIGRKFAGADGALWEEQAKCFLRKEPTWGQNGEVAEATTPADSTAASKQELLEMGGTIMVSATTEKFVAKDHFVKDTSDEAKVKISYLSDNLKAWFLKGKGKIEQPITEQAIRWGKLRQSSLDGPILKELGGEAKAEMTLTEVFSLMEKQPNREEGTLLNNGWANIFYVRDQNNVLRAVGVSWSGDGWDVSAGSVGSPRRWDGGYRVFSRNFVLESVLESSEPSVLATAQA